ncbi:response regulator [Ramlibacter humi]|uniref:Response regulator n=1 Tax=Ramlibacter humi TaxID=2530451 RepID=A0A4Z0BE29_9BURK|nr:winged helix-turn-helix domain-containing protein [Ramlibacter humi]TFY96158.1 response regulator [Ramlibacter humi]
MTRPDILVVEDEGPIAQFVGASLSAAGMSPRVVGTVRDARREWRDAQLLVVDLGLPDEDGLTLIREVRALAPTPILVLSARAQEAQKIEALDAGADDYLTKPFGVGELLARVRAMLRRAGASPLPAPRLQIGELDFDRESRELQVGGRPVHLTPLEFKLFERLSRTPGKVVTHRQLLADVWGNDQVDQLHYLRIYMGHLRAKIEADPAEPRWLLTELGVGYRLADE